MSGGTKTAPWAKPNPLHMEEPIRRLRAQGYLLNLLEDEMGAVYVSSAEEQLAEAKERQAALCWLGGEIRATAEQMREWFLGGTLEPQLRRDREP